MTVSEWIEVKPLQNQASLLAAQAKFGLGVGELSTILLGKEIHADAVLLDDFKAQQLAKQGSYGRRNFRHRWVIPRSVDRDLVRVAVGPS